ncbi:hypothetical protein [Kineococcus arenarius]
MSTTPWGLEPFDCSAVSTRAVPASSSTRARTAREVGSGTKVAVHTSDVP